MTNQPCKYEGDQVLLVEGRNDCYVVINICRNHNVPQSFGIYDCESDVKVLRRLNALVSTPEPPRTIGIIIDADNGIEPRWQSFRSKIERYNYNIPDAPDKQGTVIGGENGLPRLGIWLMPDNDQDGMLEDFCLSMMAERHKQYTIELVSNVQKEEGICTFKEAHFSKAVIHTYLAWQDEPGYPLGQAISSRILNSNTDITNRFIEWLNRLFNPLT